MGDLESLRKQIQYQLSQLSSGNEHHQFEDLCRHLTRHRICSNILPATGPVSAGGDQGRDFETFRSYLAEHPIGDDGGFVGLVSSGPIVFACSLQIDIVPKIRADVERIMGSGNPVEGIYFFCVQNLPAAKRHKLQEWARREQSVRLEIFDGRAIAEHLIAKETFWIAVKYLGLNERDYPVASKDDDEDWYISARKEWNEIDRPHGLADLLELIDGARRSLYDQSHREDLPFWMSRIALIAKDATEPLAQHRSIAEVVALSVRGLKTLDGCDGLLRQYFQELGCFPDTLDLEGAAVTINYAIGALKHHVTSIKIEEIASWHGHLRQILDQCLVECDANEKPNRYAELLYIRGYIALNGEIGGQGPNIDEAISFWKRVLEVAPSASLYRITRFADHLTKFITLFGDHPGFQDLTDCSDILVAKRHGGFAAAEKARDRAFQFYKKGDIPRAIDELHRAKVNWFADETLRGSVIAFFVISIWYREIGLAFAAKYYSFAAAFIAVMSSEADIRKLFPRGLALAAISDYEQGAWTGFLELATLAERGAFAVLPATEREISEDYQNLIYATTIVIALTERVMPDRSDAVIAMTSQMSFDDMMQEVLPYAQERFGKNQEEVRNLIDTQLLGPPFTDLGAERTAVWSAYGTEWRVTWANSYESTPVAEEFCSVLQIFLADVHALDLCLLRTKVEISLEVSDNASPCLVARSSNASRQWKVTLPTQAVAGGIEELQLKIFSFGSTILWELSLLPQEEFLEIMESLFKRGLASKTSIVRPYSELFRSFVPGELFADSKREQGLPPRGWHPKDNKALPWRKGDGRSYVREDELRRVGKRYENSLKSLRRTLPELLKSVSFRETIGGLRAEGWRDWHILMAIFNAVGNLRMRAKINAGGDPRDVGEQYWRKLGEYEEESSDEPIPPAELLTPAYLHESLQLSYLATLKQLGFEIHQQTPDIPAIEDFLRFRYHYWDDDIAHEDPFLPLPAEIDEISGEDSQGS